MKYVSYLSIKYIFISIDNLAFNKPTYQQYPYTGFSQNLTEAANAVDGLRSNLSVWSGQCAISSEQKHNATWWVNLTSILSIRHITIYYRTGNKPWGMLALIRLKVNLNYDKIMLNTIKT